MTKNNFHSTEISAEELRDIVEEIIADTNPDRKIKEFTATDDGIDVVFDNGQQATIEIDWNEFILRYANGLF